MEFAVTAPIVFLLFFAQLEFSRANLIRHSIQSAAYEGARRGIVPGATVADVREAATSILTAVSARDAVVTVDPTVIQPDTSQVTVTIDIPLISNTWGAAKFLRDRTLTSSITLNREMSELTTFE